MNPRDRAAQYRKDAEQYRKQEDAARELFRVASSDRERVHYRGLAAQYGQAADNAFHVAKHVDDIADLLENQQ